tara:strand:- start:313 stop:429 length:117 start_codon:yes stop_codon:yes gene_type:complete
MIIKNVGILYMIADKALYERIKKKITIEYQWWLTLERR